MKRLPSSCWTSRRTWPHRPARLSSPQKVPHAYKLCNLEGAPMQWKE